MMKFKCKIRKLKIEFRALSSQDTSSYVNDTKWPGFRRVVRQVAPVGIQESTKLSDKCR